MHFVSLEFDLKSMAECRMEAVMMHKIFVTMSFFFAVLPLAADDKAADDKPGAVGGGAKPAATIVDVWPEGKMPGRGAKEPEADLPPKGDGFQRITNISRPTLTLF